MSRIRVCKSLFCNNNRIHLNRLFKKLSVNTTIVVLKDLATKAGVLSGARFHVQKAMPNVLRRIDVNISNVPIPRYPNRVYVSKCK